MYVHKSCDDINYLIIIIVYIILSIIVPYYVYHEFLENGALRDFLLKHFQPQWQQGKQCQDNEISEKQSTLIKFAKDVANGIEFLHINKVNYNFHLESII